MMMRALTRNASALVRTPRACRPLPSIRCASTAQGKQPLTLYYFDVPARAEATRILLTLGKLPFEEVFITKDNWPEMKLKMPLGQVPVLQLEDGRMLAQSGAIERYAAKLAGLYPADPATAAFADQACFLLNEASDTLAPTFALPDVDAKIAARQALLQGKFKDKLMLLSKLVTDSPYLAGKELCYADIVTYAYLANLRGGFMDGIPVTLLDDYPVLKAFFQRVANVPGIKARYANAIGNRSGYLP